MADDAVFCSDGWQPYRTFGKKHGLTHYTVANKPGSRVISGAFHIQNVNALHSQYRLFIERFYGPATKYLYRYLRWFLVRKKLSPESVFRTILEAA